MIKIKIPNNNIKERKYIIDIVFNEFLGLEYEISMGNENWNIELENGNKIIFEDHFFNKFPHNLEYLNLKNIPSEVKFVTNQFTPQNNIPIIFGRNYCSIKKHKIYCGIDIFASSFFMLTRWEEYVNKERDEHECFPEKETYAIKNKINLRPIVNEYIEMLWNFFKFLGIQEKCKTREYKPIITHDIDCIARYDTLIKYMKACIGDIVLRKNPLLIFKTTFDYILITLGLRKDNFDTFDYLMDISERNNLKSHFYFIPGHKGENDVRYDIREKKVKSIIQNIKKRKHIIGIHGSYDSFNDGNILKKEVKRINNDIIEGRQHYLRFNNPTTWQIWNDNNLKWDTTVGYNYDVGFRAGVCFEYSVFNILTRQTLNLKEIPLIVMENGAKLQVDNQKEFIELFVGISKTIKKYNGNFVLLWHNNNFNHSDWTKYASKYETIVSKIK